MINFPCHFQILSFKADFCDRLHIQTYAHKLLKIIKFPYTLILLNASKITRQPQGNNKRNT